MFKLIRTQILNPYRSTHDLGEKLFSGGPVGRCSFNDRLVTIFGGYGYLGSIVSAYFGREGTQLVIPYRCTHHDVIPLKLVGDLGQVQLVPFDPYDINSLLDVIQYSDTVVNCIGNHMHPRLAKKSNIDMANLISEAVKRSPNVKTFIHVSAMSQNQNVDVISQTKKIGEQIIRKNCPNAIIVRPSSLYHNPDRFVCLLSHRRNPAFESIMEVYARIVKYPTSMKDVARAIVKIASLNEHHGKTFELYSNESFYMFDLKNFVCKRNLVERGVNVIFWKLFPWKTLAKNFPQKITSLGIIPPHFYNDDIPSRNSKIFRFEDIGIRPIETEAGILDCISVMKEYPLVKVGGEYTQIYEQPHIRLISKKVRDAYEYESPFKPKKKIPHKF